MATKTLTNCDQCGRPIADNEGFDLHIRNRNWTRRLDAETCSALCSMASIITFYGLPEKDSGATYTDGGNLQAVTPLRKETDADARPS